MTSTLPSLVTQLRAANAKRNAGLNLIRAPISKRRQWEEEPCHSREERERACVCVCCEGPEAVAKLCPATQPMPLPFHHLPNVPPVIQSTSASAAYKCTVY